MRLPLATWWGWLIVNAGACAGGAGAEVDAGGDGATEVSDTARPDPDGDVAGDASDGADTSDGSVDGDVGPVVAACGVVADGAPRGTHRGEVPPDLALETLGADGGAGGDWVFSAKDGACESVVVLPDRLTVSQLDATSLWESEADLDALIARSPPDVRYLFVTTGEGDASRVRGAAMAARIDAALGRMDLAAREAWRPRLAVLKASSKALAADGVWLGLALEGPFSSGLAIDHARRLRGVGFLADVGRYDAALAEKDAWPWRGNLAYAAWEAVYMHAEEARRQEVQARGGLVQAVFGGETLAETATTGLVIPADLERFDTVTLDVVQRCPDPEAAELGGNCGAWDYLAHLWLVRGEAQVELARFITAYQREAHWVADVTPLLGLVAAGETVSLRWDFAPPWNTQPTATWMTLRWSDSARGVRPSEVVHLFGGGAFGSTYNAERPPVTVRIPDGVRRAELRTIVTGHGSGANQCAEFCAHVHTLEVGGKTFRRGFPEASTPSGCVAQVVDGMTPNQGGTWWFGRGGWCPGAPVAPWVVDVSDLVVPGEDATITYRGELGGRDPPDGSGDIVLDVSLVLYR